MKKTRRGVAVLATFAAPVILYLVFRTAAIGLAPATAELFPPRDPSRLLMPVATSLLYPGQRVTGEILSLSHDGSISAPLAFEPFFIAAKASEQAGEIERAIQLMEEAKRRRPSFVPLRLQLAAYYGQVGRLSEMLAEMNFVLSTNVEVRALVLPELVKLLRARAGRIALATALRESPEWREDFFRVARAAAVAPEHARELLEFSRVSRPGGTFDLERGLYLSSLVRAGEYARSRQIWLQRFSESERRSYSLLFDGQFRRPAGDDPFSWNLHQSGAGRAEITGIGTRSSKLRVDYFGGSDVVLARQTLALAPGRYVLRYRAHTDTGISSGKLQWSLSCLPQESTIVRLVVEGSESGPRNGRIGFSIPISGCSGQMLRLLGEPGEVSQSVTIEFFAVEITREN